MIRFLFHLLRGYVRVCLTSGSPERFLNLARNHGLDLWKITCDGGIYSFFVYLPHFFRLRPPARKAGVRLHVDGRRGLPFFLLKNRHRWPCAAGAAAFFLLLALLSCFIWDIEISGNFHVTDDQIRHWLAARDIVCGMPGGKVNCPELEEQLRMDFPEIIWVSARVSGTRLLIHVREGDVDAGVKNGEDTPADLVAARDGVITGLIVRSGLPRVKAGDAVKKGDILVSGELPVLGDFDELLGTHLVRADADITARMECTVRRVCPGRVTERAWTGKRRFGLELLAGSRGFVWLLPAARGSTWRVVTEKRQLTAFGNFYLPLWVSLIRADEYVSFEREARRDEIEAEKEKLVRETEEKFLRKGVAIIQNDVTISNKPAGFEIREQLVLSGPIGVLRAPVSGNFEIEGVQTAE